jgi:hypothetical protein
MKKVITIRNQNVIAKITKILDEKAYIHKKIKENKISEIKSDIHFAKPL